MINIKKIISQMPEKPGIYIYRDKDKKVIYVGKAKKLKRRVSSYFMNKANHSVKTIKLVENIADVEYIVTDTEEEALILECNFIKRYRPKYNILLKDDKSYPYIKVTTNEEYPRIFHTRHYENDRAKYYGPYPDALYAKQLSEFLSDRYKLRKCGGKIVKSNARPCLNYDMKLCDAPCAKKIEKDEYQKKIEEILSILSGDFKKIICELENEMSIASNAFNFEEAAKIRDQILLIKRIKDEQKITSTDNRNTDIIALAVDNDEEKVLVQVLTIRDGKMVDRKHMLFENAINETRSEILLSFIKQFYSENYLIPKEIMIEEEIDDMKEIELSLSKIAGYKVNITVPKIGKNKRLLVLAKSNADISILQYKQKSYYKDEIKREYLGELKTLLGLDCDIVRIESYDISHISGVDNVASMVVFTNGEKDPSEYRKFKIKQTLGNNDVACMKEVLERRIKRYLSSDSKFNKLPDLIMMDGGINQVNAALEVFNMFNVDINICGLVKDDHHRTNKIYYKGNEINIDTNSELFKFITRVQDEVHNTAIGYFKKLHNKNQLKSRLDDIPMIGEKRKIALFNKFKTFENIKNATLEELVEVPGITNSVASNIIDYFRSMEEKDE